MIFLHVWNFLRMIVRYASLVFLNQLTLRFHTSLCGSSSIWRSSEFMNTKSIYIDLIRLDKTEQRIFNFLLTSLALYRDRGGYRTAATFKMARFVIIVNGFYPLTIITKRSILDVAAVLDPPLGEYESYRISFSKELLLAFACARTIKSLWDICVGDILQDSISLFSLLQKFTIWVGGSSPSSSSFSVYSILMPSCDFLHLNSSDFFARVKVNP